MAAVVVRRGRGRRAGAGDVEVTRQYQIDTLTEIVRGNARRYAQAVADDRRVGIRPAQLVVDQARVPHPGVGRDECARCLRSEEHTSELQSLMRTSYAVFCLKKKNK